MLHELKEDAGTDRSRWQGKEWDSEFGFLTQFGGKLLYFRLARLVYIECYNV